MSGPGAASASFRARRACTHQRIVDTTGELAGTDCLSLKVSGEDKMMRGSDHDHDHDKDSDHDHDRVLDLDTDRQRARHQGTYRSEITFLAIQHTTRHAMMLPVSDCSRFDARDSSKVSSRGVFCLLAQHHDDDDEECQIVGLESSCSK